MHTALTRRKLEQSFEKGVIKCQTGGQPIHFMRIRKPRKESAASPLKRTRAHLIARYRRLISGSKTSAELQQVSELKLLTKETRLRICDRAGVKQNIEFKSRLQLAMKVILNLTWAQSRAHCSFLRKLDISYASEKRQRAVRDQLLSHCQLSCKLITFWEKEDKHPNSTNGMIQRDVPSAVIENLPEFVTMLLDEYEEAGMLRWNDMPENEVWIKVGGDHGGDSFKISIQIANQNNPNSKDNTIVIACFQTKDNYTNLSKMAELCKLNIESLRTLTWKGKDIKLFMFGDYAYLANMFGLSGSMGIHFCLWCTKKRQHIQDWTSSKAPSRTLAMLKDDHRSYKREGKGKKSEASSYNNVVHRPLWDIQLERVCPPYLHILLGIVKKHHDLLVEACHQIDKSIAEDLAEQKPLKTPETLFEHYVAKMRQVYLKTIEMKKLEEELYFETHESTLTPDQKEEHKQHLTQIIHQKKLSIDKFLDEASLDQLSGPVASNLETILQQHSIIVQAYHSRSFTGNHCNQYLRPNVIASVCASVSAKTYALTENENIRMDSEHVSQTFHELNTLYSNVHQKVSHSRHVNEEDLPQITININQYMTYFRKQFPKKVIPKMHFLEDHIVPWMKAYGFGMGLHGEQGGEGTHRLFKKLRKTHSGIKQPLSQLEAMMKDHLVATHPQILKYKQPSKKRVKRLK